MPDTAAGSSGLCEESSLRGNDTERSWAITGDEKEDQRPAAAVQIQRGECSESHIGSDWGEDYSSPKMTTVRAAQREAASILERELFKPSGIQADCVRIATHNVVTLTGNLPAVLDEALTHEIDVLCVQETRHTSQTE